MQLGLVEGEDDLSKSNVVGVPVLFRVGENNDVVFGK